MGCDGFDEIKPVVFFIVEYDVRELVVGRDGHTDSCKALLIQMQCLVGRVTDVEDASTRSKPRAELLDNGGLKDVMVTRRQMVLLA